MVYRLQFKELRRVLMNNYQDVCGNEDDLRRRIIDSLSFDVTKSKNLEQTIIQVYKQANIQEPQLQSPNVQLRNHFPHNQLLSHSKVSTSFLDKIEIEYPRSLPFYKIKTALIKPFYFKGKIDLTFDVLNVYFVYKYPKKRIINSYDYNKKEYKIQIILRIEPVALHDKVYLPRNLKVILNEMECKLPNYTLSKINDKERHWRISLPINLNKYLYFNSRKQNKLTITCLDPDTYIAGVFLAKKLTCEELIEKLRKRPFRTIETSKEFIKNFMDNKIDIVVDSVIVTLNDPLTKIRMTLPARGVECIHIQCFDAMHFLKINENMQRWKCPICKGKIRFENIEIDGYFLNIIQSSILSEECEKIILFKDGTWIEKKPNSNSNNDDSDDKEDHLKLKRLKYNPEKEFCENYNAIISPTFNNNKL